MASSGWETVVCCQERYNLTCDSALADGHAPAVFTPGDPQNAHINSGSISGGSGPKRQWSDLAIARTAAAMVRCNPCLTSEGFPVSRQPRYAGTSRRSVPPVCRFPCFSCLNRPKSSFRRPRKRLVKSNESKRDAIVAEYPALSVKPGGLAPRHSLRTMPTSGHMQNCVASGC